VTQIYDVLILGSFKMVALIPLSFVVYRWFTEVLPATCVPSHLLLFGFLFIHQEAENTTVTLLMRMRAHSAAATHIIIIRIIIEFSNDISDMSIDTEYFTGLAVFKFSSLRLYSVLLRAKIS
jgi:hypothetical protein